MMAPPQGHAWTHPMGWWRTVRLLRVLDEQAPDIRPQRAVPLLQMVADRAPELAPQGSTCEQVAWNPSSARISVGPTATRNGLLCEEIGGREAGPEWVPWSILAVGHSHARTTVHAGGRDEW